MHQRIRQNILQEEKKHLYFWSVSFKEITFNKQWTLQISLQESDSLTQKKQYSQWMVKITAHYNQILTNVFVKLWWFQQHRYLYAHINALWDHAWHTRLIRRQTNKHASTTDGKKI